MTAPRLCVEPFFLMGKWRTGKYKSAHYQRAYLFDNVLKNLNLATGSVHLSKDSGHTFNILEQFRRLVVSQIAGDSLDYCIKVLFANGVADFCFYIVLVHSPVASLTEVATIQWCPR